MPNYPENVRTGKVLWRLPNITYGFLDVEVEGLHTVEDVCKFNRAIKRGFAAPALGSIDDDLNMEEPKGGE